MHILGTKSWSFARPASARNHWASSPAPLGDKGYFNQVKYAQVQMMNLPIPVYSRESQRTTHQLLLYPSRANCPVLVGCLHRDESSVCSVPILLLPLYMVPYRMAAIMGIQCNCIHSNIQTESESSRVPLFGGCTDLNKNAFHELINLNTWQNCLARTRCSLLKVYQWGQALRSQKTKPFLV